MLDFLTIRHVALIDDVTIQFHEGLQVLTGETGAGKSIVVDAVNLILGGRADRELIRSGCDRASVEAVFDMENNTQVSSFMEQEGIEYDGRTVTVYREISTGGRNICRICGVVLPLARLKELSSLLLDLHGQNEHQFLADPDKHLSFLDQSGDNNHQELLKRVREDFERFVTNHRTYAALVRHNGRREERMAEITAELEVFRKARIRPGEEELLSEQKNRLSASQQYSEAITAVRNLLCGEEEGSSAISRFKKAADDLRILSAKIPGITEMSSRCESAYYEMEDIAYQLSDLIEQADNDPETLERIEARLDLIRRIEKKYGIASESIPAHIDALDKEYKELAEMEDRISAMSSEHKKLLSIYRQSAARLSDSRRRIARMFEEHMMKELRDLGMGSTRFEVRFLPNMTGKPLMPTPDGDDRIEFMISPNPGEPLKPLAKIASGGELSRMMLALKSLDTAHSGVDSMIFDEIDTGISGRMAQVVAEKMITISRSRQVICVTHLPQIAASADYHYLVRKDLSGERTNTYVTELDPQGRIGEVSRMISGAEGITEESDAYASGMLRGAEELKKKMHETTNFRMMTN